MSIFTANLLPTDLKYPINTLIRAIVSATNDLGSSDFSSPNTVGVMTQSRPISTVVASITSTTQTSITVGWTPLTLSSDLGYAPLIRYQIYWNQGPDPVDPWVYK